MIIFNYNIKLMFVVCNSKNRHKVYSFKEILLLALITIILMIETTKIIITTVPNSGTTLS